MSLIGPSDFPAVRAVLDVTLDARALPDSLIMLAPYAPEAEARILTLVPDAEARIGDDARHLKLAAIAMTAAFIAPSMPSITSETVGPTVQMTRAAVDWAHRAKYLMGVAQDELAAVPQIGSRQSTTSAKPRLFWLAPGRRGY